MTINQRAYRYFLQFLIPKQHRSARGLYFLFQAAALAVIVVFAVNLLSIGSSNFGEWGDFFGGVLNPILTFIMFMGLLITIVIQQTELRESRAELKRSADALVEQGKNIRRQSFEATFSRMLVIHNEIVNSIDLRDQQGNTTSGRDCFNVFYTRLNKLYRKNKEKGGGNYSDTEVLALAYRLFWKDHQTELGHYFRYLYNMVRFIVEQGFVDGPYIRLVRAQLSDQELLLLFYNCVSEQGGNFTKLVEDHALLDNMPLIRLLDKNHAKLISKSAFN